MEIINNGSKGNGRLYDSIQHITRITISTNDEPEKYLGAAGTSFEERYSNDLRDFKHKRTYEEHRTFKIYLEFEELAANYVWCKSFLSLPETHKALQLLVFFLFFCQPYLKYWEFGAKNYFTRHRTANTIDGFRDSFPVLKIRLLLGYAKI